MFCKDALNTDLVRYPATQKAKRPDKPEAGYPAGNIALLKKYDYFHCPLKYVFALYYKKHVCFPGLIA